MQKMFILAKKRYHSHYLKCSEKWVIGKCTSGDFAGLARYPSDAPHVERVFSTCEHFVPLLIAAGVSEGSRVPAQVLSEQGPVCFQFDVPF